MSTQGPYRAAGGEPPPYVPAPLPETKPVRETRYFFAPHRFHDHPLAQAMESRGMTQEQALDFLFKEVVALRGAHDELARRGTIESLAFWKEYE